MSEKYLGENSTPILINQIKEKCTQKRSTLPIASIDELGNTYQYTGTTSGSLVHGYFYECVSDGAVTPTYSWQNVNVQPTVGTPTAATTTFNNTTSGLQATNVQDAIDEVEGRVDNIEGKIPSTATSTNKLVDHDSLGTAAFKDSTDRVSPNNTALVESQSVYSAINTALSSIYTPRGDITCAELTSDLLIAANVGNIYETSDSGTTSALFLQGAGVPIPVGSNVGIINAGKGRILFNLMANAFDLTGYQKKDLTSAVEGQTTVEGALGALSTNKATQAEVNDIVNVLGAKNLIPYPYYRPSGYTSGNMTGTYDANGVITINKTADTTTRYFALYNGEPFLLPNTTYILSLELTNATNTSVYVAIGTHGVDMTAIRNKATGKYDVTFTTPSTFDDNLIIGLYYGKDIVETNAIVKVMIRLASITDDTYEPYAKTNRELTTENEAFVNNVNVNGCKNICPYELTNWGDRGITITDSADGNYKILNGTCTGNPLIISLLDEITPYPIDFTNFSNVTKVTPKQLGIDVTKKYVFSRQSFDNVRFSIYLLNADGTLSEEILLGTDPSVNSVEIDFSTYTFDKMFICAKIGVNSVVNNYALKPMLCLKSDYDLDDKWTPPAKTNLQLTKDSVTWDDLSKVGAVNFLNHTATNLVQNGITFTVNADRSITANGTATAEEWVKIAQNVAVSESVRASGCPKGGTPSTYFMTFSQGGNSYRDYGDGVIVPSGTIDSVYIVIKPNATVDIVFKPMITPVSYNGDYVPYAMTNKELTEYSLKKYWQRVYIPDTHAVYSNTYLEFNKRGHVVQATLSNNLKKPETGLITLTLGNVDAELKPFIKVDAVFSELSADTSSHFIRIVIDTTGTITLYMYGESVSNAINCPVTFTYLTDN